MCYEHNGETVWANIKTENIEEQVEIEEEQSGFTAGRSCIDNIFTLRQVMETRRARDREVHIIFIDLEKAYDKVPRDALYEVLEKSKINKTYISAIKRLYKNHESSVKEGRKSSELFKTTKGLLLSSLI